MLKYYDNEISEAIKAKGKVYVYSHGDFDGIATAALFIKAFVPEGIETKIVDINYDVEKTWGDYPFDPSYFNVVLDFKSANGIDLWVDHHPTGKTDGVEPPKYNAFDPEQPSAAHAFVRLLRDYNPKFLTDNKQKLGEFLHWAKVIDSARYDNIDQVMRPKDRAILLDKSYQMLRKPFDFFVESLVRAELNFDDLMTQNPLFRAVGEKAAKEGWKCFFYAKDKGQCTDNGVIFLDLMDSGVPFARYAPWAAFKEWNPKYCIASYTMKKGRYGISVSSNPFLKENRGKINLSEIAVKHGGGGHPDASGINCDTKEDIYLKMQSVGEELEKILNDTRITV